MMNLHLKGRNRLNSYFPVCLNKIRIIWKEDTSGKKNVVCDLIYEAQQNITFFNTFNQIQEESKFFPLQLCCPSFPLSALQHAPLFSFDSLELCSPPQKKKTCLCKKNTSSTTRIWSVLGVTFCRFVYTFIILTSDLINVPIKRWTTNT